jgi:hypothetical protein
MEPPDELFSSARPMRWKISLKTMLNTTFTPRVRLAICPLLLAVLLVGCENLNHQQYQVSPGGSGVQAAVSAEDREAVKEVLQTVAAELHLKDLTTSSLVPDIVVSYSEIDVDYPIKLTARVVGNRVLIDLMHSHPYGGETDPYRRARAVLTSELKGKFGDRFQIAPRLKPQTEGSSN